jgi:riboflavin transporter FmnP
MKKIYTLVLAAMFLALGLVMPFLTMQIPEIGSMLLPMHIPVIICGFVCGWQYGLLVGFTTPLLRSLIFAMPPMFPTAICMAFELAIYGMTVGILFRKLHHKKYSTYLTLLVAMLLGRIVWGLISLIVYPLGGLTFTWQIFIGGALLNALPGIILQFVLIPPIVILLSKAGVLKSYD